MTQLPPGLGTGVGQATRSMLSAPAMLDLTDVTLRIAGRPLLEGANLHVPAGTRLALVGRNGTGKSTLLRLIAGELQPDRVRCACPPPSRSAWSARRPRAAT